MKGKTNKRKCLKARDPCCRYRQTSGPPPLTLTHLKQPQPDRCYWVVAALTSGAVILGHAGGLERSGREDRGKTHWVMLRKPAIWFLCHLLSSFPGLSLRGAEAAASLHVVSCSGPLSSLPMSAVASLGSRPSEASPQLLMLTVSYQHSQVVAVYYSACRVTYYCLLTCIYSFPKNPEEYISFLLNIKLENMLMFKKIVL